MHWTTEKPTKPGWYWWSPSKGIACIVEIVGRLVMKVYFISGRRDLLNNVKGEWSSEPIAEPEEQA